MLKLHNLEISGFKSFVDPVNVEFAGGVTAIVGPNGCGKSNLSEAMTWVLGEQSAKSLRGGTMEDVIFNGAENRKPLGMAECTLTLRTDPSFPHSEDGWITIGRRVFRGGEGQYRLNGKVVRLKEIRDLLMDTGLGLRAYSVIEQGKIGMILSGKPQERRKLLEEAAGITRYKSRKNVAELKLQEATANLLRLDDVVGEVERALRSLKRQASSARRYQEKELEYRALLEKVLLGRHALLAARLAELRAAIEEAGGREAELAAALHRDEAALAAARERLETLAQALAARHQRAADLAATIEGRQEFLKANRQNLEEIAQRVAQDRQLAGRREEEMAGQEEALAALEQRRGDLAGERDLAALAAAEDERRIAAAEHDLRQVAGRSDGLRAELQAAAADLQAVRQRGQQAQIELERGNFRRHHLDAELERRTHETAQAAEALTGAQEKAAMLDAALAARAAEQQQVAGALEATMRQEAEAAERQRGLEAELATARQRQRLLAELSRAHAERRGALLAALAGAGLETPRFLAEAARAVEGWERSLDVYLEGLGGLTDAVVLAGGSRALDLARALAGRSAAVLIEPAPADWASPDLPLREDDAVLLSIGEALGLSREVAAALPPAFLVRSAEDAERLARRYPGMAFLSRQGVWVQAGTFHVEGEVATPGVLERESELAGLERSLPDLAAALGRAAAELDGIVAARTALAREANRLQGETAQLRQELAVARARQEDAQTRHRRLSGEQETLTAEQRDTARELERVTARRAELQGELAAAEERHGELTAAGERAQADLDAARAAREALRTASAGRRGHLALLDERLDSHDREVERLRGEVERGRQQVAAWREEAERLSSRSGEIAAALERAERELMEALELRAAAEEGALAEQERLDRERQDVRLLDERIAGHRQARDAVRGEIEERRVAHAGARQDAEHLALSFGEQFGRPLGEPAQEASAGTAPAVPLTATPAAPSAAAPDAPFAAAPAKPSAQVPAPLPAHQLAELEADLARAKSMLERLGPVNALAVQEHDEQAERLEFLTVQRADVASSVESLRKTIREINETSSERFRATFDEVNKSFNVIFARLFRGGEAEMRLLDEDDTLESGIEIVARPPGKRLQNLMLLSGGEKALTAIALLFALFQTKPSPFCILDEVDAPLDDVNTARFVDLLREMAGDTQFIVITHNKLTMEVASYLYGVTMEEKGVSKLVSVEIDKVQPEQQRATA